MLPMHVLVVEDEPNNREIAVISLASAGYRVTACANGAEAVDLVADDRFDVVLMDLAMPVMNGLEATRRLRLAPGTRDALIMAVSGCTAPHERQSGLEAGCDLFLAKPYRRKTLLNVLAEALGRRALAGA
jgi:CheY-like chemotaxis protein